LHEHDDHHAVVRLPPRRPPSPPSSSTSKTPPSYDANGKEIIKLPSIDVAVQQSSIWFVNAGLIEDTTPPGGVGFHGEVAYRNGIRHGGDDGTAVSMDYVKRWGGEREAEREAERERERGRTSVVSSVQSVVGGSTDGGGGGGNPSDLSNFSLFHPNGLGGGGSTAPSLQSNGYHPLSTPPPHSPHRPMPPLSRSSSMSLSTASRHASSVPPLNPFQPGWQHHPTTPSRFS